MKNKLITATLLKGWASKRESQSILPELIKRLIISSGAKVRKMSIPSGDNVYIPGWDGQVSSDSPIFNVSAGISLWEIGTNSDVRTKANNDYNKRTNDSLGYDWVLIQRMASALLSISVLNSRSISFFG